MAELTEDNVDMLEHDEEESNSSKKKDKRSRSTTKKKRNKHSKGFSDLDQNQKKDDNKSTSSYESPSD